MNITPFELTIPSPRKGPAIKYDMTKVAAAEARVHEIAIVTAVKAPELMSTFSQACFTLGRYAAELFLNHRLAEKRTEDRKAVLIVDVIPTQLEEKKLGSNETNRQALLNLDPEYSDATIAEAETEAALIYVERKLRDMEGALNAVKRAAEIMNQIQYRANPNLSTGGMDDALRESLEEGERLRKEANQRQSQNGLRIGKATY